MQLNNIIILRNLPKDLKECKDYLKDVQSVE